MYSLLMKTVASALIDLAKNKRHIGATPAILAVLHTWTSRMTCHPHVHLLITDGGVTDDGFHWRRTAGRFPPLMSTMRQRPGRPPV